MFSQSRAQPGALRWCAGTLAKLEPASRAPLTHCPAQGHPCEPYPGHTWVCPLLWHALEVYGWLILASGCVPAVLCQEMVKPRPLLHTVSHLSPRGMADSRAEEYRVVCRPLLAQDGTTEETMVLPWSAWHRLVLARPSRELPCDGEDCLAAAGHSSNMQEGAALGKTGDLLM